MEYRVIWTTFNVIVFYIKKFDFVKTSKVTWTSFNVTVLCIKKCGFVKTLELLNSYVWEITAHKTVYSATHTRMIVHLLLLKTHNNFYLK